MLQPGRKFSAGSGYRYGFNGKENDKDVKGDGNQYDYGFRIYDPRIGRFLSIDPLIDKYPELSSYQFTNNSPIANIDLDGQEDFYYILKWDEQGKNPQLKLVETKSSLLMKGLYINGIYLGDSFTKAGVEKDAKYYGSLTQIQFEAAAGSIKADIEDYKVRQKSYDVAYKEFAQFYIGVKIAGTYTEENAQKQQQTANNKTTVSGEKKTTNKTSTDESGGKNNQTNPQKAGATTNSASANTTTATPLDWSRVNKKGETASGHVNLHGTNDIKKDLHGIFSGDPITQTNNAWNNKGNIQPIRQKNGNDLYVIPSPVAGTEGGSKGSGITLNNITIITKGGSNTLVTSFPSQ